MKKTLLITFCQIWRTSVDLFKEGKIKYASKGPIMRVLHLPAHFTTFNRHPGKTASRSVSIFVTLETDLIR